MAMQCKFIYNGSMQKNVSAMKSEESILQSKSNINLFLQKFN